MLLFYFLILTFILPFIKFFAWFELLQYALKSGLKMHLEKFKNEKFSYPGKVDTLSPGPHPLQHWSFVPWHIPSMLLMSLVLPFYPNLCMVSITTKALKSGLKMCLARFRN